MFKNYR
jgi:hypothetical protein